MTKKIFLILAVAGMGCSLHMKAAVPPVTKDTVQLESYTDVEQMLRPLEPTYRKGVFVTSPWNGNMFVSLQGGASAFIGKPIGCADLFDRVRPTVSASLGKWFTPQIGARIGYGGWQFKDCGLATNDYHHFHADLMWNVLGYRYGKVENPRWGIIPFIGLGLLHNRRTGHNPFAVSYGIQGQYRICKRLSALLEIGNISCHSRTLTAMVELIVSEIICSPCQPACRLRLERPGWKRAVDASPYIRQNEWLIGYATQLSESNRRYTGQHDRAMRTINELKKILEIEGLLDKYSRMFDDRESLGNVYPVNDYSGLNSLRARLKNRHWDGKSPLSNDGCSVSLNLPMPYLIMTVAL